MSLQLFHSLFSFKFFKEKMRECVLLATYQVVKPFKLYEVISIMGLPLWTNLHCFEYISFHKLQKLWFFMEYWNYVIRAFIWDTNLIVLVMCTLIQTVFNVVKYFQIEMIRNTLQNIWAMRSSFETVFGWVMVWFTFSLFLY